MATCRRQAARVTLAIAMIAAIGCRESPAGPSAAIGASFPASVAGVLVACDTCIREPRQWISVEFPVTIVNPSDQPGRLATVLTRVVNRTRGGIELGRNLRPNTDHAFGDTEVPAGGVLTVGAGIVFFPVPPPRDDLAVEVTVSLSDGRSASHVGSLTVAVSAAAP